MNLLDNKYYRKAMEIIAGGKLGEMESGKHVIDGDNLFVNICDSELKTPEQARFEAHKKYIDIQVPLSCAESYGIMPVEDCKEQDGEFNTGKDVVFFKDKVAAKTVYTAQPGQAVVFTPADAHAPMIGKGKIHKAIFKVIVMGISCVFVAVSCAEQQEAKVMARFVPERYDDFVFENDLVAGRIYGEALESCGQGQITSPGVDVWVKIPGALVADQRYKDELENGRTYHKDWGNGKDCYKVGRSLGAGASAPLVDGALCLPATNFRSWTIDEQTPDKVVFTLSYPEWELPGGVKVSLDKRLTVTPGTYFVKVEDKYNFTGTDKLTIAAGINRHPAQKIMLGEKIEKDRVSLWEHASDQTIEPEDGLLGVAVVMPAADTSFVLADGSHSVCCRTVVSGETLTYCFGSCWTKGDIKTYDQWLEEIRILRE